MQNICSSWCKIAELSLRKNISVFYTGLYVNLIRTLGFYRPSFLVWLHLIGTRFWKSK